MASDGLGFRPLYQQVYDYLIRQIVEGKWGPSDALPSEQALAVELGVSQGTVRKALDVLVAENLIVRRQGKGTYVAEQTQERSQFRFFRIAAPDGGARAIPKCANTVIRQKVGRGAALAKLKLASGSKVFEVTRLRLLNGRPMVAETITVPAGDFPNLQRCAPLPNALYTLYQSHFGINIVTANEELSAVAATRSDTEQLGIEIGTPLLHIDRVAIAIDGRPVEWRVSRCHTQDLVYAVTLR